MSGKRYPEDFKIEAVRQVTDRGCKVAEVVNQRPKLSTCQRSKLSSLATLFRKCFVGETNGSCSLGLMLVLRPVRARRLCKQFRKAVKDICGTVRGTRHLTIA